MARLIQDKIKLSAIAAESLYYRLVFLVGDNGSGKTSVLKDIANDFGTTVININLALSRELLEMTVKQRSLRLPGILSQLVEKTPSPVVLDNLEILFDKDLKQDPLRLLQGISRNRTIIASWNGTSINRKLLYAEIGHPEYRSYDMVDAMIVNMDDMAMIDPAINIPEAGQA